MHDLKWIRDNPRDFDAALKKRGLPAQSVAILKLDEQRRKHIAKLQDAQARRNTVSQEIGKAKAAKDEKQAKALMEEVATLKATIREGEEEERRIDAELNALLAQIANLPLDDVPVGTDASANKVLRSWGKKPKLSFKPKQHFELGEALGLMDFEAAGRISGARFVVLKGALARLERAIASFMLDLHTQELGYQEVLSPALVRDHSLYGTGQLPKFADDLFVTTNDLFLIPTAEVPLTNLVREQILNEADLPTRVTAWTPCFRAEAGAAGKDTRGMIRQHQFSKVELVSITTQEQGLGELERMTNCAEEVLKRLELPYQVVALSTGDMGFSAQKTYDLEVWLPGQEAYREISSCSLCGEFQARRMNARYRPQGAKDLKFVHTLNGSGLAVGRTMIAILENYQNADGTIAVPKALHPYMGGVETIGA